MNIAIDFGGTTIKLGIVDHGKVISSMKLMANSDAGMLRRLVDVEKAVYELLAQEKISISECHGIGVATPGVVDTVNKTILSINDKYSDAVGFSFQAWINEKFSLPFILENDARAALIGETTYGVAKGESNAVLMIFGTGIGTAAMMEGNLLRGLHYQAGILGGHFITDIRGNLCNCGSRGCLEAQSGHWALTELVKTYPDFEMSTMSHNQQIDYSIVIDAVRSGDKTAETFLEYLISHWSAGIVNLIHAYDPETVVLSGGLMKSKDDIVPLLERRVHQLAWTPWGKVQFVIAEDPETSVLLGVSHLLEA